MATSILLSVYLSHFFIDVFSNKNNQINDTNKSVNFKINLSVKNLQNQ